MGSDSTLTFDRRKPLSGSINARRSRRMRDRAESVFRERITPAWRHIDVMLPLAALGLAALGVLMVLSATRGTDPDHYDMGFMQRQLVYSIVGFVLMVLVASFDYRRLRSLAWLPYVATLLLLVLVLAIGSATRGSQAWFELGSFQMQPSELSKIAVIVAVAALLAGRKAPLKLRLVGLSLVLVGIPLALILMQPDLGTGLAFGAIAVGVLLAAGTRTRHLVLLTAFVTMACVGVLNSDYLDEYQRDRLTTFLDQENNQREESYNLDQSKIAVGSGGPFGAGLFDGTQTRLGNVPEQHTDFIFAAAGEELGFAGSATILALFSILAWRIWRTAQVAQDRFGTILCIGVLTMIVFQAFQNIGMTIGIMPITGLPLPFMSYGGSSVISAWLAIGLVLNVHMRRFR
jgi:rod shape determining protein RodA